MTTKLSYGKKVFDKDWGALFAEVKELPGSSNIFVCHTTISDLTKIANKLSMVVMDNAWVMNLDNRSRRAYETIVEKTAQKLVKVLSNPVLADDKISTEFGEIMVSMGSARALEVIFSHIAIPVAELWKPKIRGNEGFDFHTVCMEKIINFGEAKFSRSNNPFGGRSGSHSGAGGQADGFINENKHLMDNMHLPTLAGEEAAENLDNDLFGIVLAFSINSADSLDILNKAIQKALEYTHLKKAKNIYIVGVSHVTPSD